MKFWTPSFCEFKQSLIKIKIIINLFDTKRNGKTKLIAVNPVWILIRNGWYVEIASLSRLYLHNASVTWFYEISLGNNHWARYGVNIKDTEKHNRIAESDPKN